MTRPLVSVVFSFRNEEDVLPELVQRTAAALRDAIEDYELVFVDDASQDRSFPILLELRRDNDRIRVVRMSRRFGVTACVFAGFAHACGDAVVYLDADLQDPPELIPSLLERWRAGADVVHTIRTRRRGDHVLRRIVTWLGYRIMALGSSIELPVDAGDFKLMSRRVVERLLECAESEPYIRGLIVWAGFRQDAVRYQREPRFAGTTHFPLLGSLNPWRAFLRGLTSFSEMPVYLVLIAGLAGVLASATAAVALAAAGPAPSADPIRWLALWIGFCWASGLVALGTVGLYVLQAYADGRRRPRYVIAETVGCEPRPATSLAAGPR
jgi:dolichol-phosphate mannosyltransferase